MKKVKVSQFYFMLYSFFFLVLLQTGVFSQTTDSLIQKVENGLLPFVLIEGEPAFNLQERMDYYHVPGISITVIKDFKIDWSRQYGLMDAELNKPVTGQTLFNVGSLSKGLAALTVLRLVQEGKISLNGAVNEQLISWKIPENEFTKQGTVTPLLLMNHSGGAMFSPGVAYLPDNFPTNLHILNGENPSQTKAVVIDKIPGTEYQYSNAGYAILQQLVVDVSGQSFPQLTHDQIFQPLEMNSSTFEQPLPQDLIKIASAGHMSNGQALAVKRYYFPHMAAGGLWTTTSDYARYVIELQKSYLGKSNKVISKELAREMLSPHVSKQYGLGVFMREMYGEINYFGHMGDSRGFFAGFVGHLYDGYGAVVFTNGQNGASIIREITNGIAKVYGWEKYLPEEFKIVALDKARIDQYIGRYALGSDNFFKITLEQEKLFINQFNQARLFHVGDGKFVVKSRKGNLQFIADPKNKRMTAVYNFSDELGRFLTEPQTCTKMKPGQKVPIELLEEGRLSDAVEIYREIKIKNPADISISENRFNSLGYFYMGKKQYEQALVLFKLNVEFYPQSANCYDSLAEAYMNSGDRESAIHNYEKSLELNPGNQNAKNMLEKLNSVN